MQKKDIFTSILDKSSQFHSICMKSEQFLLEKLLKNDVFWENPVKFGNHVETKPLEPVLWNFAWIHGKLYAFRWYKIKLLNIDTLSVIKFSFVTVVFDDRVSTFRFSLCDYDKSLGIVEVNYIAHETPD